uniref:Uncharacterized protein n=1 Tax=Lepeophtheirus salmonis TaxID=72036 RepID=A0A0K2T6Z2_LEPSM
MRHSSFTLFSTGVTMADSQIIGI